MSIIIEQRSRSTVNDSWGDWSNLPVDSVTDGTFTNTDLVEYRTSTDILITDVTNITEAGSVSNNYTVTGTGIFDKLMTAFNSHIDAQYKLDRIKGSDYANVYLAGTQSAMQQAVAFVLQEKSIERDLVIKDAQGLDTLAQIDNRAAKTVAELNELYGYTSSSYNANGIITLGTKTDLGTIEREMVLKENQYKLSKIPSGRG